MKLRITHQGNLLKITPRANRAMFPRRYGRGDRSVTTRFTKRSRKNLLEKFAIIDKEKAKNATFITLTYVENFQDHKASFRHLREIIRRIMYKKNEAFAVWKKEIQDRGAIHYHLMVWNLPYIDKEKLAFEWMEITGQFYIKEYYQENYWVMPPMTRVEYCKNPRKCWYYLSKYLAKVDNEEKSIDQETGEIEGTHLRKSLENDPDMDMALSPYNPVREGAFQGGFNIGTNLQNTPSTGRWWGWVNRKNIPLAPIMETEIELTWTEYYRYRIDLRRVEAWTADIHQAHTVKLFWFHENLDPIMMLIRGKIGEKVFEKADRWERVS